MPLRDTAENRIVLEGSSGRVWLVGFHSGKPEVTPTSVVLPDFPSAHRRENCVLSQCTGDRLLARYEDDVYVFSFSTGRALLSLHNFDRVGEGLCLTPDGTMLLAFCSSPAGDFTCIYSLPDASPESRVINFDIAGLDPSEDEFRTTSFHDYEGTRLLDQPHSAIAVAVPNQPNLCRLIIGCYGYVVDWMVALGTGPKDVQVKDKPRSIRGFGYDPVTVQPAAIYPHVCFDVGFQLFAFNLETGIRLDCSWNQNLRHYGMFSGAIPGIGPSFLVRTDVGWIRWSLDGRTESVCTSDFVVLGETECGIWALHKNDPGRIVQIPL
jgi:hypothetical protein